MRIEALVDSNVIIAALVSDHLHHPSSASLLSDAARRRLAAPAHGFSEAFNIMTRGGGPYRMNPRLTWDALQSLRGEVEVVGLTAAQTLDAIGDYANAGGIGARLYDHLIGRAAVIARIGRLITWNVGHMRSLFPELEVLTPEDALALPPVKDRP